MTSHTAPQHDLSLAYQNMRRALLGFLRKQVTEPALAEDLLQEVFLKALAASARGDRPHSVSAWLYTIARHTVIDHYRAKRPMAELPNDLMAQDEPDLRAAQSLAECLRPLAAALPPLYRDTLLATELEGRTLQSLATEWGLSLSAVKSRASRGRKMLKDSLLACCRVETSRSGEVLDFHRHVATSPCRAPGACA